MKIAIVGAGISGLTAAWRLFPEHDITVFEAGSYAGGHTNTVDVTLDGEDYPVDTGFIVFNDRTYPSFTSLLGKLGVASRPTSMSFSVRSDVEGLEYNGSSLNGLFAQRRNLVRPAFYRMLADILRFNREAPEKVLGTSAHEHLTVAEYLKAGGYSREFAEHYLLPMGAAIWSCPLGKFGDFPIRFIVEFYRNHGLLSLRNRPVWHVIEGGSRNYVRKMAQRFADRIRLNTPVNAVCRTESGVMVEPRGQAGERFDHVIFACHSNQAQRILKTPTVAEREVLPLFTWERNLAVLHTDERVLPRRRRAWASWNYLLAPDLQNPGARPVCVTYQMNILQHIRSRQVLNVTLNGEELIDPSMVLARFEYEHPVFTVSRAAAQARHPELINRDRVSFCGAWWGNGFHEDGVVSALRVADALQGSGVSAWAA